MIHPLHAFASFTQPFAIRPVPPFQTHWGMPIAGDQMLGARILRRSTSSSAAADSSSLLRDASPTLSDIIKPKKRQREPDDEKDKLKPSASTIQQQVQEATRRAHASLTAEPPAHHAKPPHQSSLVLRELSPFSSDSISTARWLLGSRLVRTLPGGARVSGVIVECEAYMGPLDAAAHSYGNRRSERNESMYMAGGTLYVYLIYGLHHCVNIVCGTPGQPTAVLIRALEPDETHIEHMAANRKLQWSGSEKERDKVKRMLCSGPGKLCQALGIDRSVDRQSLLDCSHVHLEQGSWVEDVSIGPRVGVGYAGQWANAPLRFCKAKNEYVSKPWSWTEGRKKGR